jgi:hypothetical protein
MLVSDLGTNFEVLGVAFVVKALAVVLDNGIDLRSCCGTLHSETKLANFGVK